MILEDIKFDSYLVNELENIDKYKERKTQIKKERVNSFLLKNIS